MSTENPPEATEPLSVYAVLATYVDQLAGVAWQKLGLQPDMMTGKVQADLAQAKVAIDSVAALAGQLESELDESDKRQFQNVVRDLRMNYLNKSKEA